MDDIIRFFEKMKPVVDDYGNEHWVWTAHVRRSSGVPLLRVRQPENDMRPSWRSARSVIFSHIHGREPENGMRACGVKSCVHPSHIQEIRFTPEHGQNAARYKRLIMRGPVRHDASKTIARVQSLADDHAMTFKAMSKATGIAPETIRRLYYGETKGVTPRQEGVLLGLCPIVPQHKRDGRMQPMLPTARRLQALAADGFPGEWVAQKLGVEYTNLQRLQATRRGRMVMYSTAEAVRVLYEELEGVSAEDVVDRVSFRSGHVKAYALRKGYAPRHCWDDDTIDDPNAIPEYTGECGTRAGYDIHRREGIDVWGPRKPMHGFQPKGFIRRRGCIPCVDAYSENNRENERRRIEEGIEPGTRYNKLVGHEQEILAMDAEGLNQGQIGERFGVSRTTVGVLLRRLKGSASGPDTAE